ncbi:MAG: hypothetical protein KJO12_05630 [Ignavibacteria bacterium]|nr:hypothetical protein [Ignavibacteria bacterium]
MSDKKKCLECRKPELSKPIKVCQTCYRPIKTRTQSARHASRKGKGFERQIAKSLSRWWGIESSFRRTPISGAWDKERAAGDIIVPDQFPFGIECKCQEGWELVQLIKNPVNCKIMKFWKQTVEECKKSKKPLLVFSKNQQPSFALFRKKDLDDIIDSYQIYIKFNNIMEVHCEEVLVICLFDELFKRLKAKVFKNATNS